MIRFAGKMRGRFVNDRLLMKEDDMSSSDNNENYEQLYGEKEMTSEVEVRQGRRQSIVIERSKMII